MTDLPLLFADVLPPVRHKGFPPIGDDDVKVAPVEKTPETGELSPSSETTSGTQVPSPTPPPSEPPASSNLSLYISLFAIAVAMVTLFALIKRVTFLSKTAQ